MPNGVEWAVIAIALARIGAVLVPLSTLLRPPELEAQLRIAGVDHLVFEREFRGRDYAADLDVDRPAPAPPLGDPPGGAGAPGDRSGRRRAGRRAGRGGEAGRRPRHRLHLGEPGGAEGCDPHPRRRARRDAGRARDPRTRRRRPPLHPDAVLLGRRSRHRVALGPRGRGDAGHRAPTRGLRHARAARARAGDPVPRLARPGGRHRRPPRLRVDRPLAPQVREPARGAPARATR